MTMSDDRGGHTRLLLDIKGEAAETKGIVSEIQIELRDHAREDRTELRFLAQRLDKIEQRQARASGADEARRSSDTKRAGLVAAIVAGTIGLVSQLVEYLRH
jgi:hypothetical protein